MSMKIGRNAYYCITSKQHLKCLEAGYYADGSVYQIVDVGDRKSGRWTFVKDKDEPNKFYIVDRKHGLGLGRDANNNIVHDTYTDESTKTNFQWEVTKGINPEVSYLVRFRVPGSTNHNLWSKEDGTLSISTKMEAGDLWEVILVEIGNEECQVIKKINQEINKIKNEALMGALDEAAIDAAEDPEATIMYYAARGYGGEGRRQRGDNSLVRGGPARPSHEMRRLIKKTEQKLVAGGLTPRTARRKRREVRATVDHEDLNIAADTSRAREPLTAKRPTPIQRRTLHAVRRKYEERRRRGN